MSVKIYADNYDRNGRYIDHLTAGMIMRPRIGENAEKKRREGGKPPRIGFCFFISGTV